MQQKLIINRLYSVVCLLSSALCLRSSTTVEDSLQIGPFMQNKPNFQKSQMNVNPYNKSDYENKSNRTLGQNKPNSNPIKPNLKKAKMNVNLYIIEDYENETAYRPKKTNPIKPCPERIEFTLSVIEGNGPISYRKSEVRCLYFVFRLLYSVLCFLMKPKLLNFPVKNSLTGLCNSVKYPFL